MPCRRRHRPVEVHFAAGLAICAGAGCTVTNLGGGPIHTDVGGLIAAADAETHATLLELITRSLDQGEP